MLYPIIFSWDGECYQMYSEDVSGAFAISPGNNIEDAIHVMEEILSAMLMANYPDGYPPPSSIESTQQRLMEKNDFVVPVRGLYTKSQHISR